ncbi:autotransporter domain-containing protein [Hoeflea sp. AS60]|uniref:autotransporter outer membrane beta-barrel domain-containing protein n=1 Tax=Hoeflea sp. AS60 TaxID=3135780 RepID=UPI00317B134C
MRKGQVTKAAVESSALTQPGERERSKRATHVAQTFRARLLLTTALTANLALLLLAIEPALAADIVGDQTVIGPDAPGSGTLGNPYSYGGELNIGGTAGNGSVTVTAGGIVSSAGRLSTYIGRFSGNEGAVTVSGANSSWTTSGDIYLGLNSATGTLTVSNGGAVTADYVSIGGLSGTGHVYLDGGSLSTTSRVAIGVNGTGFLTLSGGSTLTVVSGTGTIRVAENIGDNGTLNIGAAAGDTAVAAGTINAANIRLRGSSSKIVFNHTGTDYVLDEDIFGDGTIEHYAGTTILTGANTNSGSTTIFGGTLQIGNGGTTGSFGGNITNNAALIFNRSDALAYAGDMSGTGSLTKSGAGTLTLTGTNTHTGGTTISAGTLQIGDGGTSGSISGDITNNAALAFNRSDALAYAGDISGTGSLAKSGAGTLTLSGTNTYTGGTTVEVGTLRAGSAGAFAANTAFTVNGGTLDLNGHDLTMSALSGTGGTVALGTAGLTVNQSGTTSYGGAISGAGSLTKSGAGTLTLTGANTHTGGTTVSGGRLVVNGSIGAFTLNGGTLGGSGTVGSFTANSGSTIAPGNSIGTLNVAGNTSFASGSTYAVEVDSAGNSDMIAATGSVTIDNGATVSVSAENGTDNGSTYAASTTYTIITAGTGVTGTFGSVSENFAFLDAALGYSASAVTLTLTRNASSFASAGNTPNQRAVANGVSSLTAGNAVYDAVVGLSEASARAAFDSLSGEIYASTTGRFIQDSHFARDAASNRIRSAFEGLATGEVPMIADNGTGQARNFGGGAVVWGQAYGSWGNTKGNGNAATIGHSTGGLFFGADAELFDGWRGGLMAGYGNAGFSVDPRSSSGNADSYTFGAYAGGKVGALGVRLGATYALHDVSTSRNVTVGTLSNALSADYTASTSQVFGEAGYSFNTPLARFEPFAGFALVHQRSGAFTESGGAAALSVASAMQTLGFTTLGLRGERQVAAGESYTASIRGSLGWSHLIGDSDPSSTMWLADGKAFRVSGLPLERDTAQIEAGLKLDFDNGASFNINYQGGLGAKSQSHTVAARFSKSF